MYEQTLALLATEPEQIQGIPREELPALIGAVEALKARLWAELQSPSAESSAAVSTEATRLLTAQEVADQTGLSSQRVYELVRAGRLPAVHIGRQVRISASALAMWVEQGGEALPGGWHRESPD